MQNQIEMELINVKAPGKVILFGEHAVVYGKKAIASAINATIEANVDSYPKCAAAHLHQDSIQFTISIFVVPPSKELSKVSIFQSSATGLVSIYFPHIPFVNCFKCIEIQTSQLENLYLKFFSEYNFANNFEKWSETLHRFSAAICPVEENTNHLLLTATTVIVFAYLKIFIEDTNLMYPSLKIQVSSNDLPLGSGLGSSAAYSVSLAAAFLLYAKQLNVQNHHDFTLGFLSLSKINELAFLMEKLVHGSPSGIDNTISTYGGAITYTAGKLNHLTRFPKLNLLIVDTHVERSTKILVNIVKKKMEMFPTVMNSILQSIHEICEIAEKIFIEMNEATQETILKLFDKQKELIAMNQHLLNCIGVGHPKLDEVVKLANEMGLACKLTGAGGGGCAIIILDGSASREQIDSLQNNLKETYGFSCWKVELGCEGVKILHCADEFICNVV